MNGDILISKWVETNIGIVIPQLPYPLSIVEPFLIIIVSMLITYLLVVIIPETIKRKKE